MATRKTSVRSAPATPPRYFSPTEVKVIEAYVQLCYQHGVTGITLQMVAKKAKVAFGTVHYYFGGAEKSMEESAISYVGDAGARYIAEYLSRVSSAPGYRGVDDYIIGSFQWMRELPAHVSYWLHFYYLASINSGNREKNGPFLSIARQRIQKLLYEGVGMGTLPELGNIEELAKKINALLFGTAWVAMCDPTERAADEQLRLALDAMHAIVKSHAKKGKPERQVVR